MVIVIILYPCSQKPVHFHMIDEACKSQIASSR